MTDLDTQVLSRLLKILERSVKAGEDIDPFAYRAPPTSTKSSPKKPSTKKASKPKKNERASRSLTPKGADEDAEDVIMEDAKPTPAVELTELNFDKLTNLLEIARDSILAADCCIALLGSDRLTKQVRTSFCFL